MRLLLSLWLVGCLQWASCVPVDSADEAHEISQPKAQNRPCPFDRSSRCEIYNLRSTEQLKGFGGNHLRDRDGNYKRNIWVLIQSENIWFNPYGDRWVDANNRRISPLVPWFTTVATSEFRPQAFEAGTVRFPGPARPHGERTTTKTPVTEDGQLNSAFHPDANSQIAAAETAPTKTQSGASRPDTNAPSSVPENEHSNAPSGSFRPGGSNHGVSTKPPATESATQKVNMPSSVPETEHSNGPSGSSRPGGSDHRVSPKPPATESATQNVDVQPVTAAPEEEPQPPSPAPNSPKVDSLIADSIVNLALKVREPCDSESANCWDNSVFSPLSISSILVLLLTGSDGNTAQQVRSFLNYSNVEERDVEDAYKNIVTGIRDRYKNDPEMQLRVANKLFTFGKNLNSEYEQKIKDIHFGSIQRFERATPEAADQINQWVANQTNNKINKVVERLSPGSRLVGINAVYFKAKWFEPFGTEFTRQSDFHVTTKETIRVSMMLAETDVDYVEDLKLGCKMIALPYKDERMAMYLMLPTQQNELRQLEALLTVEDLNELIGSMRARTVAIQLPKFRISRKLNLKNRLFTLGVQDLFTPGIADLSRMISGGSVAVDDMSHDAFIQVSEAGTEAAAATTVFITRGTSSRNFIADQPFLFFIRDKLTGVVYFFGRVVRPDEAVQSH